MTFDFIEKYQLLGAFIMTCFMMGAYHFKVILARYFTEPEMKNKFYTKSHSINYH